MEFIGFSDNVLEVVKRDFSTLIKECDNYMLSHPNSRIWLRDTDHVYLSIRLESKNVPIEDIKLITSRCPKCGSPIQEPIFPSDHYEDYELPFCNYCYAITEEDGWQKLKRLLLYLDRVDNIHEKVNKEGSINFIKAFINSVFFSKKTNYNSHLYPETNLLNKTNQLSAEQFRIRVLTDKNQLLYLTLNRVRLNRNGKLYIEHGNDKSDIVKFAGVNLKGRDKYGKRLFQGDIINFIIDTGDGEKRACKSILKSCKQVNNSTHYIVEDNIYSQFPPLPEWIDNDTIEVVGNIFEKPDYDVCGTRAKEFYPLIFKN